MPTPPTATPIASPTITRARLSLDYDSPWRIGTWFFLDATLDGTRHFVRASLPPLSTPECEQLIAACDVPTLLAYARRCPTGSYHRRDAINALEPVADALQAHLLDAKIVRLRAELAAAEMARWALNMPTWHDLNTDARM